MPKLIAIDFDRQQVRLIHAESDRRQTLRVIGMAKVSVNDGDDPIEDRIETALSEAIRTARAEKSKNKATVIVCVGHGKLDQSRFEIPPVTADELPGLVWNLAQRELTSATSLATIDFIAPPENSSSVTVTVLPEEERQRIETVCEKAGIVPDRIVPRTFGLAAFAIESEPTAVISVGNNSADVLLMNQAQPVVARSIRFPANSPAKQRASHLTNEVRRTMLSQSLDNQIPDSINHVRIFADSELHEPLKRAMQQEFDTTPVVLSPYAGLKIDVDADNELGSLVGTLLNETSANAHLIDFQNPKKPKPPTSNTRPLIMAAVCLAALIGGGYWYINSQFAEVDGENARLSKQLSELKALVKKTVAKRRIARTLSVWDQSRISWPDELRDFTLRMPSRKEMTIRNLSISSGRNGVAAMTFRGIATIPDAVGKMESGLRDRHHNPRTPGLREQKNGDQIRWTFQTGMTVKPRAKNEYNSHLDVSVPSEVPSTLPVEGAGE